MRIRLPVQDLRPNPVGPTPGFPRRKIGRFEIKQGRVLMAVPCAYWIWTRSGAEMDFVRTPEGARMIEELRGHPGAVEIESYSTHYKVEPSGLPDWAWTGTGLITKTSSTGWDSRGFPVPERVLWVRTADGYLACLDLPDLVGLRVLHELATLGELDRLPSGTWTVTQGDSVVYWRGTIS